MTHKDYLNAALDETRALSALPKDEQLCILKNGVWMKALIEGEITAKTQAQKNFIKYVSSYERNPTGIGSYVRYEEGFPYEEGFFARAWISFLEADREYKLEEMKLVEERNKYKEERDKYKAKADAIFWELNEAEKKLSEAEKKLSEAKGEIKESRTCPRCGGDGGAGGRCPKCGGNGIVR